MCPLLGRAEYAEEEEAGGMDNALCCQSVGRAPGTEEEEATHEEAAPSGSSDMVG